VIDACLLISTATGTFALQKGKDLVALHEATPSGVRLDSKTLGVSVEPDVVKNRIVEFVSKLALK